MKTKKLLPEPGVVVVVSFCEHRGALGVHNGKIWFVWRLTNAGLTGEPTNWHPCEDALIRGWSEIPGGVLFTTAVESPAGRHGPIYVQNNGKPWYPVYKAHQRHLKSKKGKKS